MRWLHPLSGAPNPSFGACCAAQHAVGSWNARGLLAVERSLRNRKLAHLAKLIDATTVLGVQETHGTYVDMISSLRTFASRRNVVWSLPGYCKAFTLGEEHVSLDGKQFDSSDARGSASDANSFFTLMILISSAVTSLPAARLTHPIQNRRSRITVPNQPVPRTVRTQHVQQRSTCRHASLAASLSLTLGSSPKRQHLNMKFSCQEGASKPRFLTLVAPQCSSTPIFLIGLRVKLILFPNALEIILTMLETILLITT